MCGGTATRAIQKSIISGLSPRVRGNLNAMRKETTMTGSIPACAGEPPPHLHISAGCKVYPRLCGGTLPAGAQLGATQGLSPRVRGNLVAPKLLAFRDGSIPACAGEPSSRSMGTNSTRVYPRVCGGTDRPVDGHDDDQGLSPRVRGNRRSSAGSPPLCGSIPACAGEPPGTACGTRVGRVYPRVCGGTTTSPFTRRTTTGLSPRVRGNPKRTHPTAVVRRSIPACAGEP